MVTMELEHFSLEQICDSGQCFRMKKTGEHTYSLVAGGEYLQISQNGADCGFSLQRRRADLLLGSLF